MKLSDEAAEELYAWLVRERIPMMPLEKVDEVFTASPSLLHEMQASDLQPNKEKQVDFGMSIKARVRMGAAELDIVRPGWYNTLRPEDLDLSSDCNCVLAQLDDGDYSQGAQEVFGVGGQWADPGFELVVASGFVTGVGEDDDAYQKMTKCWKREINARKRAVQAVALFRSKNFPPSHQEL